MCLNLQKGGNLLILGYQALSGNSPSEKNLQDLIHLVKKDYFRYQALDRWNSDHPSAGSFKEFLKKVNRYQPPSSVDENERQVIQKKRGGWNG